MSGLAARVDRTLCCGSGSCEVMAPGLFRVGDDGFAVFLPPAAGAPDAELLEDVARCCPTGAITVHGNDEGSAR